MTKTRPPKLANFSPFQRRLIGLWLIVIVVYVFYVLFTDESLSLVFLSAATNVLLLPLLWAQHKQREMENKVSDALQYFRVENDMVIIGDIQLPSDKVKRVAVDVQDNLAYCSLPFNHIQPGIFPNFTFPAEQADALRGHIKAKLPLAIIIE